MSIKDMDPWYYADNEDGSEPHGYWLRSDHCERDDARWLEVHQAVAEGRACWLTDAPDYIPF